MASDNNRDDVQTIQRQIHEKKTSILDSTRRMLGLIDESEALGTNTAAVSIRRLFISSIDELTSLS
jgi:hypothetical protein